VRKRFGADADHSGVRALTGRRLRLLGRRFGRRPDPRWVASMIGVIGAIGFIVMSVAWPRTAQAQENRGLAADTGEKRAAPPEALEHYERGRKEYLAGRYREALEELRAALELDPSSPNLVYNVARVYEDLAELDQAIKYYRRYRSLLPPDATAEREKTAKTIRRLEGARDEQTQAQIARQQEERTAVPPEPPESGDRSGGGSGRADLAFWLVASTGVALAAGGGVTGWFALRREKEVNDFVLGEDGSYEEREQLVKEANNFALASDILTASAGAAILTAALLFFTRSSEPDAAAAIQVLPGGAGVKLTF
jgi:tetratricopeptide (TPR) repeat protein